MAHKHSKPRPHAEFRHRSQLPMPAVAEVEQQLAALLSPSLLAPRQLERRDPRQPARVIRMRQRLLTLPVMVAILVTLQRHLIFRTLFVLAFVELIHLDSPLPFSDCCGIHVPRLWRGWLLQGWTSEG